MEETRPARYRQPFSCLCREWVWLDWRHLFSSFGWLRQDPHTSETYHQLNWPVLKKVHTCWTWDIMRGWFNLFLMDWISFLWTRDKHLLINIWLCMSTCEVDCLTHTFNHIHTRHCIHPANKEGWEGWRQSLTGYLVSIDIQSGKNSTVFAILGRCSKKLFIFSTVMHRTLFGLQYVGCHFDNGCQNTKVALTRIKPPFTRYLRNSTMCLS